MDTRHDKDAGPTTDILLVACLDPEVDLLEKRLRELPDHADRLMSPESWSPPFDHPCGGREKPQVGAHHLLDARPPYLHDHRLARAQPGFVDLTNGRGSDGHCRELGEHL